MSSDREQLQQINRAAQQDDPAMDEPGPDRMRQAAMVKRKATAPTGGGSGLDAGLRSRMEKSLGAELSGVRIHTDGGAAERSEQLGARAYTEGADVHFGAGEFNPGTREGDRLIAHELTHVVQGGANKGGAAAQSAKSAGGGGGMAARKENPEADGAEAEGEEAVEVSSPDDPAEKEADAVADQAVDGEQAAGEEKEGAEAEGQDADMGAEEKKDEPPKIQAKLDGAARKVYRWQDYGEETKKEKGRDGKERDVKHPVYDGKDKGVGDAGQFSGVSEANQKQAAGVPEEKLVELEEKIGQDAFSKGKPVADLLMSKIRGKLDEEVAEKKAAGDKLSDLDLKNNATVAMCGGRPGDSKGIAGAVARDAATLEQTMAKGSLREQMTVVFNFQSAFPGSLVGKKDAAKKAEEEEHAAKGEEVAKMAEKVKALPEAPATGDAAKQGPAEGGGVEAAEHMQLGSRKDEPGERRTQPTVASLEATGMGLSIAELQNMFPGEIPALTEEEKADPALARAKIVKALEDKQVTWAMGINKWKERDNSEFAEKLSALHMPFGAGPSGTTSRVCETAMGLGVPGDAALRTACIGYLLPINAHSLWEVVEGAKTQGIDGPDFAGEGLEAYKKLEPFEKLASAFLDPLLAAAEAAGDAPDPDQMGPDDPEE